MISNGNLTLYHKSIDKETKLEKWTRINYDNIWWFGGKGASTNKGYESANDVEVRISYELKPEIENIKIGDILVKDHQELEITRQQDLVGLEVYNITSIKDNNFGTKPHIHISGK